MTRDSDFMNVSVRKCLLQINSRLLKRLKNRDIFIRFKIKDYLTYLKHLILSLLPFLYTHIAINFFFLPTSYLML